MKNLILLSLLAVVTSSTTISKLEFAQSANAKLTAEERAKAIQYMTESRDKFLAEISNVSEAQWKWKAAPDKWSVGEVAEHIYLAEGRLFGAMQGALATPPNPDWEAKTKGKNEFLEKVLAGRQGRAQAPEAIVPSGKLSRDEVVAKFKEARAKTLAFAETTQLPLKEHTLDHPMPVFGTLNAYQWLIYAPLHNIRHNLQIAEVKASPGYPAK